MDAQQKVFTKPAPVKILEKTKETARITTIKFSLHGISPVPGQFFMVWVPGIDEIPMSVSSIDNTSGIYEISIAAIGDATKALCGKQPGELIGIRGPFGNGFKLDTPEKKICFIGGGVGMACLKPAIDVLVKSRKDMIVVNAARTENELLYHTRFKKDLVISKTYFISTDDGSCGEKCFGHELLLKLIETSKLKIEKIYTCGPELMMKQVFLACKKFKINIEASLERMMRCGNGLCGLCAVDPTGLLVCKDGPIFTLDRLDKLNEFGNYTRDFSGKKLPFKK
nr:dihydroorotate dehydrogenase electron transfer subunit [Candidatus Sigynarchaeota archaeon]